MRWAPGEKHEMAMSLVDDADMLAHCGDEAGARAKYVSAARLEELVVGTVPVDRPRSKGLLCLSAVSMWLCAGGRVRAATLVEQYLAGELLPGFASELRALIEKE